MAEDDRMTIKRELEEGDRPEVEQNEGPDWLQVANTSFTVSTEYMRSSLTTQWEKNLRMWQSRHPSDSKYYSAEFAARSKIFRPKTRSAMRKREAASTNAFFATLDIVNVEPNDDSDEIQRASAAVGKELLNYRLTKTIPWFLTCIGAYQDANVMGYCISRQGWIFEEKVTGKELQPVRDPVSSMPMIDESGAIKMEEQEIRKVVADRPDIALIPPENIRFDHAANWLDPLQASPYLIVQWPMYVTDIKSRMKAQDGKTGQPKWQTYDDDAIRSARDEEDDVIRRARLKGRQDPQSDMSSKALTDFDVVFVRECYIRMDGEDYVFWTLGSMGMLTEPEKTSDVYWYLNRRPYRMGRSVIETHKAVPSSIVELGGEIQTFLNETANQRIDNVRLAMNARYFVRSGRNVDLESLRRGSPGSSTMMQDPEKDVVVHRAPDVTSSAYVEQDRANVDYDELIGHFSAGTVQTERNLNETVGGMNLLSQAVNSVQDYDLRVFSETWAEPVLSDLLKMEQALEDDATVLAICGKKAQLWEEFGINEVTDQILEQEAHLTVAVGFGATDPMQRLQKFQVAAQTVGMALGPQIQQQVNAEAVIEEVFGILGYKNGKRFFNLQKGQDPQVAQLQQRVAQLEQELQSKMAQAQLKYQTDMAKLAAESNRDAAQMRAEMVNAMRQFELDRDTLQADTFAKIQALHLDAMKMVQDSRAAAMDHMGQERERALTRDQGRAKMIADRANAVAAQKKDAEKASKTDSTLKDVIGRLDKLSELVGAGVQSSQ